MDWKYRDPKTGKVFDNIKDALEHYCPAKDEQDIDACKRCAIGSSKYTVDTICTDFSDEHPAESARLMGYEVIPAKGVHITAKKVTKMQDKPLGDFTLKEIQDFCDNQEDCERCQYSNEENVCVFCVSPVCWPLGEGGAIAGSVVEDEHPAEKSVKPRPLMGYEVIDDSSTEIDEKPTDAPTTIDDTPTVSCDITTEEDEMKCYRNGGCGPYEQLSCGECPASKPEYKSGDDEGKTKQDKPRLAEVLGVEVGEKFKVKDFQGDIVGPLSVNAEGFMTWVDDDGGLSDEVIYIAINHPESIIRAPRLTETELAICKAVGAKWVSRDKGVLVVELWRERPEMEGGVTKPTFVADTDCWVADVDCNLFPSVKPGDCICVEDAGNDKDDDNSNL